MTSSRMEAFSDAVIAIIMTIMVLEFHVPEGSGLIALRPLVSVFPNYVLSFVFVGIYWNNHHHLLQAVQNIDGRSLWANLHLLFWLSLIPFVTAWMGNNDFAPWPVAMYGVVQMMCAIAYFILARSLLALHGKDSDLATALGSDVKGKISIMVYLVAIPLAFIYPWLARMAYLFVVLMWLIPDRRIEKILVR